MSKATNSLPGLDMSDFLSVQMNFVEDDWRADIPGKPGWYAIETDAPLAALESAPLPLVEGKHYKVAKRLKDAQFLIVNGAAILPEYDGAPYIVYSGEHGNLKARAREHARGNKGTGCLALAQYDLAKQFTWTFYYRPCESHVPACAGNKMLRNFLEQKWRAVNGWPVLCSR